jgi:hypothetical protein
MNEQPTDDRTSRVRHRLGMSRRDLLRRGAVVGGTLLWTVPVIKTISSATTSTGSPLFGCCECRNGAAGKKLCNPGKDHKICYNEAEKCEDCTKAESSCRDWCAKQGRAYCFHTSPQSIQCTSDNKGRSFCGAIPSGGDDDETVTTTTAAASADR